MSILCLGLYFYSICDIYCHLFSIFPKRFRKHAFMSSAFMSSELVCRVRELRARLPHVHELRARLPCHVRELRARLPSICDIYCHLFSIFPKRFRKHAFMSSELVCLPVLVCQHVHELRARLPCQSSFANTSMSSELVCQELVCQATAHQLRARLPPGARLPVEAM
jgi:hypothetical protein